MMAYVAVDVGGTGSRARFVDSLTTQVSGPPLRRDSGHARIEEVINALADALPPPRERLGAVAIGAAGIMTMADPSAIAAHAIARWPAELVIVASDVVTSHIGAWKGEGGAVIAAGTGVTALGTDLLTVWSRADGWGPHLGDLGGGAWIGARGLSAALSAHDGRRNGSRQLRNVMVERWGAPELLPAVVSSATNPAALLASFTPAVVAAADEGDTVAIAILERAAGHLADTAVSVLVEGVPPRVALLGGIADCGAVLTRPFIEAIQSIRPDTEVVISASTSLEGAIWLAEAACDAHHLLSHPPFINTLGPDLRPVR